MYVGIQWETHKQHYWNIRGGEQAINHLAIWASAFIGPFHINIVSFDRKMMLTATSW